MKVVAILQARMGSTRLPGKVLLPLAGKSMLQNIIERVRRATRIDGVALTIPRNDYASFFNFLTEVYHLHMWDGDENDLVGRYLSAATLCKADVIVRIPCDNPCVDPFYIDRAIEDYLRDPYVFLSNTTDSIMHQGRLCWVDGIGAEVMSYSRLQWLDEKTHGNTGQREHPHRYFLDRYQDDDAPDCGISFGPSWSDLRLDVNTQEDYDFIKSIYDHFGHNRFTTAEIVEYVGQANR